MAIWMHPYGHQTHGGGLSWLNQGKNWVQTLRLCQGRGQEPLHTGLNFYYIYVLSGSAPLDALNCHISASLWPSNSWRWVDSWLNQGNNWVQTLPLCQGRGKEPMQTG